MKKALLIALLLIPFLGISQTTKPIDSFLGIKFGTSREDLIAEIKAKGGVLNPQGKDPDYLTFSNVKLGGRSPSYFFVYFMDNKVYRAGFLFKTELETQAIPFYNNLVTDVSGVYGVGKVTKSFQEPYTDGDGYETNAISLGKANYLTVWTSGDNFINIFINTKLSIVMNYYDGKANGEYEKKKKEKEKSDF